MVRSHDNGDRDREKLSGGSWEETSNAYSTRLPENSFSTTKLRFLAVEISKKFPYPLARVTFTYTPRREEADGGLRLDIGKCVFLDHPFENQELESIAQEFAPQIAKHIGPFVLKLLQSH